MPTQDLSKFLAQDHLRVALRWTLQGKRKQCRPKATWRRTAQKEIKAISLTWGEAKMTALNRIDLERVIFYINFNQYMNEIKLIDQLEHFKRL